MSRIPSFYNEHKEQLITILTRGQFYEEEQGASSAAKTQSSLSQIIATQLATYVSADMIRTISDILCTPQAHIPTHEDAVLNSVKLAQSYGASSGTSSDAGIQSAASSSTKSEKIDSSIEHDLNLSNQWAALVADDVKTTIIDIDLTFSKISCPEEYLTSTNDFAERLVQKGMNWDATQTYYYNQMNFIKQLLARRKQIIFATANTYANAAFRLLLAGAVTDENELCQDLIGCIMSQHHKSIVLPKAQATQLIEDDKQARGLSKKLKGAKAVELHQANIKKHTVMNLTKH